MDFVVLHAQLHPDKPAVSDLTFDRQWHYRQFDQLVAGCVAVLLEAGVAAGERVACLSKNRAEVLLLHLACARLGAIFVPEGRKNSIRIVKLPIGIHDAARRGLDLI